MVVVTLEPTTTKFAAAPAIIKSPLLEENPSTAPIQEQCVISKSMLLNTHNTDSLLFLKFPTEAVTVAPPPSALMPSGQAIPRVVSTEDASRKRPAQEAPVKPQPNKKARLLLVAALPVEAPAARRTVHFELQDNDNGMMKNTNTSTTTTVIKTHVRMFERMDVGDRPNAWWTRREMMEIMSREKSAVSVMSYCCDHYATEVLNLMRMARDRTSLPGMANSESTSPLWVANSPARGLERDIVQGFKQRKRQVIRKVLESQRVLKMGRHQVTGERPPQDVQSQLLSTQYQKWSHPSVRFAQVLAEGDAQVVVDNANAAAPSSMVSFL